MNTAKPNSPIKNGTKKAMAETAIAFIESLSTVAANHHSAQLKLSREHLLKRSTQKPNVSAG